MGLFDVFARRKLIDSAVDALLSEGLEPALAMVTAGGKTYGAKLWTGFIARLQELKSADARAAMRRFIELFPADPAAVEALLPLADELEPKVAVELCTAVLTEQAHEGLALKLADAHLLLGEAQRAHEVLELYAKSPSPPLQVKRGVALLALGRAQDALPLLREAVAWYDRQSRDPMLSGGVDAGEFQEAHAALNEAIGRTEGAEAVTVDLARRRQLDPRAGRNFRLLADSLKVKGPRLALTLELEPLAVAHEAAARLVAAEATRAAGLCRRGQTWLRELELDKARADFEACLELEPEHFGAQTGAGVALEADQEGWRAKVLSLPELPPPPGIERVVADWPALGRLERRVVVASVDPLSRLLGRLAAGGRRIRVLPLDVRVTDLPEFAGVSEERVHGDHRSFAALGGVAGGELAVAGVDGLLDVTHEGWTFAHELSHLCELVLGEEQSIALERLYRDAKKARWAFGDYALSNRHEFFAVHYTDWLCTKYGIPLERPSDSEGRFQQVLAFFETL